MKRTKAIIAVLLCVSMVLSGCAHSPSATTQQTNTEVNNGEINNIIINNPTYNTDNSEKSPSHTTINITNIYTEQSTPETNPSTVAEKPTVNAVPSYPPTAWVPSNNASPSKQDLDSVKNDKKFPNNIVYPKSSSYLSKYEVMYVKSELGHSIYLFWDPKCTMDTKRNHYVYEGDAVTVIAREGSASCIIYMNPEGHAISGWVESGFLVN